MADRPAAGTPYTDPCAVADNAEVLGKLLNEAGTQTTYNGVTLISYQDALDKFGFGVAPFTFATGGVLDSLNLLVSNSPTSNMLYRYVGPGSAPITVTAGTNPVGNPSWQAFAATSHTALLGRDSAGAHPASAIQMDSGATAEAAINEGRTSTKMTSAIIKDPDTLPADHMLLQSRVGPFRAHMEPDRPIENGTVTKLDWMLDPYDASATLPTEYPAPNFNYRIFNVFTKTGNATGLNGENGAACIGTKNRADGNTWGVFTSMHYGFNDCAVTWGKAYYFDTSDSAWRAPMKNFWYETKPIDAGDYVLWDGVLYQAQNTGNCGATAPVHLSGTVSDGAINWLFIRDFKLYSSAIKPTLLFGDVDKMPKFGFPTCGTQHATDALFWNGVLQRFETAAGTQGGYIGIPSGESTLAIGAGSSLYRFSSTAIYPSTAGQSLGRGTDPFSAAHINTLRVYGQSGFNGSAAIAKPTITGSRGGNAALASLLTALASYGLITDSTTA